MENIKNWYSKKYPGDLIINLIKKEVTFEGLYDCLLKRLGVYKYLGIADSVIRERLFIHLTELQGLSYLKIYEMWLNENDS